MDIFWQTMEYEGERMFNETFSPKRETNKFRNVPNAPSKKRFFPFEENRFEGIKARKILFRKEKE